MGSNDSLAGLDLTTEEEYRAAENGGQSERSKHRKALRGAPPSSLSQPVLSDCSRSSSPSKTSRTPSNSLQTSSSSSKSKTPTTLNSSWPSNHNKKPSAIDRVSSNLRGLQNDLHSGRGKASIIGRAVGFKHHPFLPRAAATTPPATLIFQPQFPSSETHYTPSSYRAFEFKTPAPISPTMDISVTGEILPSSSILQQLETSPVSTVQSNPTENNTLSMSSTIETTSSQTFQPETQRGYDGSPMSRLISQYKAYSDDNISTQQRAMNLSSKKSLLQSKIIERKGFHNCYSLHLSLLKDVKQVVNKLQIFLERSSSLIPERSSYFKVDPRDTFLNILRESSDMGQIHTAWMGLSRRLTLAQENLVKYKMQYWSPLQGENIVMPTSPVSTDIGIYKAIEDLDDLDLRLRYLYDNVPHHQDQIKSPQKLRDGSSWEDILSLPNVAQRVTQEKLPTIVEYLGEELEPQEDSSKKKGKRRITDEFISPPSSPHVLNVGYGTPFKSSSQFFMSPGGVSLLPPEITSQQNVLLGLGLPHTPAFENIVTSKDNYQPTRVSTQIRSWASNPFEGRPLPPHMRDDVRERQEGVVPSSSIPVNRQNTSRSQRPLSGSDRGSSRNRSPSTGSRRGRECSDQPGGDPDGSDDNNDGDSNHPHWNNEQLFNGPPSTPHNGGGGGGNPGGGGGGQGPSSSRSYLNNQPPGNIPYGNLVATIRNELKQDQLPVWDRNKDTAIEYFWKIQQLAALEGDIPVALGYWLWKSLKENSKIWMWFTTLPFTEQSKMRTHYLHYLKGIKDNYLGQTWQINMNRKYESQSFRQEGFERESPPAFIVRCIMYT